MNVDADYLVKSQRDLPELIILKDHQITCGVCGTHVKVKAELSNFALFNNVTIKCPCMKNKRIWY